MQSGQTIVQLHVFSTQEIVVDGRVTAAALLQPSDDDDDSDDAAGALGQPGATGDAFPAAAATADQARHQPAALQGLADAEPAVVERRQRQSADDHQEAEADVQRDDDLPDAGESRIAWRDRRRWRRGFFRDAEIARLGSDPRLFVVETIVVQQPKDSDSGQTPSQGGRTR